MKLLVTYDDIVWKKELKKKETGSYEIGYYLKLKKHCITEIMRKSNDSEYGIWIPDRMITTNMNTGNIVV